VSKGRPVEDIRELYDIGHRDFGENYVQDLLQKHQQLPFDIKWHFIGHVQSNKVKLIVPFIHLVQGVDSYKLLLEIDKHAAKVERVVPCLLQVHIAQEDTKFGFNEEELMELVRAIPKNKILNQLQNVEILGLMGMATFTEDLDQVEKEFLYLGTLFDKARAQMQNPKFQILSMGMSNDYAVALANGSTMVRIGSLIFGERGE
jgi:pyridoxal phosphate enzyme (YggS family)